MKKILCTFAFFIFALYLLADDHVYLIENDSIYDTFTSQIKSGFIKIGHGDRILFKSGEKFTGQLFAENQSGTPDNPIVIDSYSLDASGNVVAGKEDKPVISHQPPEKSADSGYRALFFKNSQCIEIRNLIIENSGGGVSFLFINGVDFNHIYVENCEMSNITGTAVMVANPGPDWNKSYKISKGSDVIIKNNIIKNCGNLGIYVYQGWNGEFTSWEENNKYIAYWFSNVVLSGNRITDITNNGIILWGASSPLIEKNYVKHPGKGSISDAKRKGWGQGIFVSFTLKAVIQYNEVCDNEYTFYTDTNKGDGDAGGIGIDYFSYDTLCQNNYLHDNAQNGIAVMANYSPDAQNKEIQNPRPVKRAVIRDNVCINNSKMPDLFKEGTGQYAEAQNDPDYPEGHIISKDMTDGESAYDFWRSRCGEIRISGPADDCEIYNNVFISSDNAFQMISEGSWWGYPQDIIWTNNIFYSVNNPAIKLSYLGGGNRFENNRFNFELKDQNWMKGITDWHPKKASLLKDTELYSTDKLEIKKDSKGTEKWISPKPVLIK
ncbi:MAG TPA: right-handed parallel beta-helix repeat-containing protein [Clostridiales bacterium]|nr:right-handed parallel beta-helix repeat-containing protein [Clostridiales bacterium]HQP70736.1 right-handed parallel beta-helix repeat-containing protein [Clostridiales bacterium]